MGHSKNDNIPTQPMAIKRILNRNACIEEEAASESGTWPNNHIFLQNIANVGWSVGLSYDEGRTRAFSEATSGWVEDGSLDSVTQDQRDEALLTTIYLLLLQDNQENRPHFHHYLPWLG